MKSAKVVVDRLYKVFGNNPQSALDMLERGQSKDQIFAETGQVVGVQNVSFEVQEGEIFVLMGLSGSGKSTLIRLINRLVDPSAGNVLVDGQNVAQMTNSQLIKLRRRDMSMVFQSFALMPHRTVLSNACFGLEVAGVGKKERERRTMAVLEQVGLASFANKLPCELSGGMQQRVGLARALAVNPSLMIMDEAFSALDPLKRKEMQDVLLDLQKEQQRTIIFVSHDLEEALRIGSRIAIMEGGRLVQVGTAQEIIDHPAEEYVRAFFDGVDTTRYLTAGALMQTDAVPLVASAGEVQANGDLYRSSRSDYAFVVDAARKVQGIVATRRHADASGNLQLNGLDRIDVIHHRSNLEDVMDRLISSRSPLPVVDGDGCYCGAISQSMVLQALSKSRGSHV